METTVVERIRLFLKENSIATSAFEKSIGVSNGYIRLLKNSPKPNVMERIFEAYPQLSRAWLMAGVGDMYNGNGEMLQTAAATATEPAMIPTDDGSGIPLITAEAMAGSLVGETFVYPHECPRFVVPSFDKPSFLIPVCGDSMEPMFHTGDLVACRIVPLSSIFFQWGKPYVINTQQGALIKRVQPGDTDDTITLISDNERYLPFYIPKSEICQIAIIVGLIRPL